MALSDYEKQVLEEMEAQFDHQPSSFRDHVREDAHSPRSSSKLSPKRVAVGSLMIVAGLLILVAAVSLGYSVISLIVGVAGFLFMLGGAWYALQTPRVSRPGAKRSSFMQRQEERWDRRSADE
ncbi:DUF3040 domain-containing protein [uncultured Actinomyces sp.]|jgi:hypothetical protein|uniref:DUF3040 domain-containing protein n=1 Tax=uncultured Actinomyces sp. TaxID=249061 RepID=UPI0028D1A522|nr:DUF3040 domain-containing protein [uncultured Actinomyces sp.]